MTFMGVPAPLWGGVIGSAVTYVITYLRERRKLSDAYRSPQREAIGDIVAATHELKVATTDVFDHSGVTGRQTSDDAALASQRAFERALLGVEKAFAVGKLSIVDAACYEQMEVAYNEYSEVRRSRNVEAIRGPAEWTEFMQALHRSVDILDTETNKLVGLGQRRLSPVQGWRNRVHVAAAQARLMRQYGQPRKSKDSDEEAASSDSQP